SRSCHPALPSYFHLCDSRSRPLPSFPTRRSSDLFCAVSMHFVLSQSVDSFAKIERKSFATWIAENRLAELRLEEKFPAAGNSNEDVEFAGRDWVVSTVIANTQDPNMRRVEVTVNLRLPNIREPVFVTQLPGFLGKN